MQLVLSETNEIIASHDDEQDISIEKHYPGADRIVFVPDGSLEFTNDISTFDPVTMTDEDKWQSIRIQRGKLLAASDMYVAADYPHPDEAAKQAYLDYRQELRDIPQNYSNPDDVIWPDKPGS